MYLVRYISWSTNPVLVAFLVLILKKVLSEVLIRSKRKIGCVFQSFGIELLVCDMKGQLALTWIESLVLILLFLIELLEFVYLFQLLFVYGLPVGLLFKVGPTRLLLSYVLQNSRLFLQNLVVLPVGQFGHQGLSETGLRFGPSNGRHRTLVEPTLKSTYPTSYMRARSSSSKVNWLFRIFSGFIFNINLL